MGEGEEGYSYGVVGEMGYGYFAIQGGGLGDEVGLQPTGAPMRGPRALPPAAMREAFGQVGVLGKLRWGAGMSSLKGG
ncbi:MAG: hypothetical protein ACJA16_005197 [Akkermansiaceae bacterium]